MKRIIGRLILAVAVLLLTLGVVVVCCADEAQTNAVADMFVAPEDGLYSFATSSDGWDAGSCVTNVIEVHDIEWFVAEIIREDLVAEVIAMLKKKTIAQ